MRPRPLRRKVALVALGAIAALGAPGCGDDGSTDAGGDKSQVTVFAASSLTDAFESIGDAYSKENPDVTFTFNFTSSSDLATQLEQGAPADVFASADEANMDKVVEADLAGGEPEVFVRNKLAIIVPSGNPGDVKALADLEREDLVVSLCNEECPAGRYALEAFDKAASDVEPDSLESDVKAVVTRVQVGEADAGIVYASDVQAAGDDVEGVAIPTGDNVIATYPIVTLDDAVDEAAGFVEFVLSPEGQDILEEHGFLPR